MRALIVLCLGVVLVACLDGGSDGGSDADGSGAGDGTAADGAAGGGAPAVSAGALRSACSASCENQARLPCPGLEDCQGFCETVGNDFPECQQHWIDVNECMARDDLICGGDGTPTTINVECRDHGWAFDECAFGEPPPLLSRAEDVCARVCLRIAHVNCPSDDFITCINGCNGIAEDSGCPEVWLDLNECMAEDPALACDPGGFAATSDPECLDLAIAFSEDASCF